MSFSGCLQNVKKDWKEHKTSCGNSSAKPIETDTKLSSHFNPIWLKIAIIGDNDYTLGHHFVYKIYDAIGDFKLGETDREIEYEDTGAIILCFALDDPQTLINIEKMWILMSKKFSIQDATFIIALRKRERKYRGKEFVNREQAEAVSNRIGAIGYMRVNPMRTTLGSQRYSQIPLTPSNNMETSQKELRTEKTTPKEPQEGSKAIIPFIILAKLTNFIFVPKDSTHTCCLIHVVVVHCIAPKKLDTS
ncbi:hypothetical protein RhiirA5_420826 [Rhizophagus irregularis]|uniref:Uncharacterized protein n=1 Tax=Rhizophagus irregularis TaxID=588596 RepID=A0A2N0PFA8_9GLOM|nr:hypothetical protein RhiirA5_420826 [Rhizophagus irregularis]